MKWHRYMTSFSKIMMLQRNLEQCKTSCYSDTNFQLPMSYCFQIKMKMQLIMVNTFYFTCRNTLINFIVTLFIRYNFKWAISLKYQLHLYLSWFQDFLIEIAIGTVIVKAIIFFFIKPVAPTLNRMVTQDEGTSPQSHVITWQIKNVIFLFL